MTQQDWVTDFKLDKCKSVQTLLEAIDAYLEKCGLQFDEYGLSENSVIPRPEMPTYQNGLRWLIAFAVEGGSEGYYVHVGAIVSQRGKEANYLNFGHGKTYQSNHAYAIARECSRFLEAAKWN